MIICSRERALLVAGWLLATMSGMNAATISGSFDISGQVKVTSNSLDFLTLGVEGPADGSILITGGTGYFSSYSVVPDVNSAGTIKDMNALPGVVNILNSLVFSAGSRNGATITYTFLYPGGGAACPPGAPVGSSCTVPGSPLLVTRSAGGTTVTMAVFGTVINGADSADVIGNFTAQFTRTPESLLDEVVIQNKPLTAAYSATFTTTPEPGTFALGLAALALLGLRARHRA